ncbi:flagellar motor protein MotB [Oceanibaculum pacificum]|uniref:Chemotaxis protein MotB n=1 Tax=Oceanibaculum pacificum TaxID=580166 RepID=A0A154VPK5_9PROT|nr:flagellar motor protein MotB [Oceanibaculum pacificum]KZD03236.1 chemotaxis protein MotB [Oceanibaculum pacificum]
MAGGGDNHPELIIKKIKKGGHGGHHGGAWKVAYADFVTAMMAFFLLLWLLNATTEEQKMGISNYFDPTAISRSSRSGSGGVLGGTSITAPGALKSASSPVMISSPAQTRPQAEQTEATEPDSDDPENIESKFGSQENESGSKYSQIGSGPEKGRGSSQQAVQGEQANRGHGQEPNAGKGPEETDGQGRGGGEMRSASQSSGQSASQTGGQQGQSRGQVSQQELEKLVAEREKQQFEIAEEQLRGAIESDPALSALNENLVIEQTPEGLRIQIVDQEERAMFPLGGSNMYDYTQQLMDKVTQVIGRLPNKITITGHTDSRPYRSQTGYTNWELSTDRANASRRALVAAGLPADRIGWVIGKADRDPFLANDPSSAQNRRISIVLLRDQVYKERTTDSANAGQATGNRPQQAAVPAPAR